MKLFLRRTAQWLHKWLALIVGIQVVAWVLGGLVFALLPFEAWVKSGDMVRKAPKPTAETALYPLAEIAARHAPLRSIELVGQGRTFYYRLTDAAGNKLLVDAANGQPLVKPDEARLRELARDIYIGDAPIASVRWIDQPLPRSFGFVDELHGKSQLWQVNFADRFNTRFYFSPESGEFLRARNDTWVWYDFFWRLHIMDYSGGDDFNNILLRLLTPLAMVLVVSGVVLLFFSRFRKPKL
ncbi:MAG: PepSY domain-containing protein [Betaproteobacteria bacterium]|nr:PepSY domain-containing protein [Betaproteobacteria bacterium]